jgi:molecular chaperone DnaJ
MADYYRILGVSRDASPDEIKRAFRRLARRHHPDVSGESDGTRFREILEAYETLSDERQRRAYDARLAGGSRRPAERPEWFADEIAIDFPSVADLVARMREAFVEPDEQRAHLSAEIELTPREAIEGVVVPLDVPVSRACSLCGGRGEIWMEPCDACRGRGERLAVHPIEVAIPPGVRHGARFRINLTPPFARPTIVDVRIAVR